MIKKFKHTHIDIDTIRITAHLAVVLALLLTFLKIPNTDFIQGLLYGYSMTGNIAWLILHKRRK